MPDGESLPTRSGWQQILAQPGERGEHVDFAFRHAFFGHRLHDLLAAATQFGQVEFPLVFTQFAIATFLDPVGQILSDLAFEPAQHQRSEFRRQPAARDLLGPGRVLAAARFVGFVEIVLRTEIAGLDEIHDTPEIEQPVFQRRAREGETLIGSKLFHRLRHLRGRVLDELRLVEDDGAELEFLQRFKIAAEQGVVGDDQVVLRNLLPQIVPRRSAFQHEASQARREPVRFTTPVMQH